MADSTIFGLTAITSGHAAGDLVELVDVSDTTMSANGTNKKTTLANLFANAPAIVSVTYNGLTITSSTGTLTIANGKTLTCNHSITFTGTDGVTVTLPTTSATMARTDAAQSFTGAQTFLSVPIFPDVDSSTGPSFRFSGTNAGLRHNGANDGGLITAWISSADRVGFKAGKGIISMSGSGMVWSSTDAITLTYDAGQMRYAAGVVETNDGTKGSVRGLSGGGTAVASAAALPLPTGRVFHVTGTTNITSITSTSFQAGVVITMIFDGILTVTDGSNLKLATNFVTTADATLTLAYDGTNWYECSRSTN